MNNVDLSVWDMATQCGSCHVGGSLPEKGFDNLRHSLRQPDMSGGTFNAYNNYVEEKFVPSTGMPAFEPAIAPWAMPATFDNQRTAADGSNAVIPSMFVTGANGWITADSPMVAAGEAVVGQMSMPNVREMDCLMCHLDGYNNIINSVAVQMGYLNASPSLSSGLMNMFSQTYLPGAWEANPNLGANPDFGTPAQISGSFLNRIKAEPPTSNCRQCHIPEDMANMSDMFDKFLSAAPMEYQATPYPMGSLINGMAMPSYDLNAPFVPPTATSPEVFFNFSFMEWVYPGNKSAAGPFGLFPMALDSSWSMFNADGTPNTTAAGGGRPGGGGPLFYAGAGDQNALKKATIPFPRADFFKRGDLWEPELEVHYRLGCGGCHYNTESLNPDLNQCDPGRGRTRMGGVESGQVAIDTHDTVKRCQDCHVTGRNINGKPIETFGAPNPAAAHAAAGLTAMVTKTRALDATGAEVEVTGNHLDVMDCTVCHVYKKSMAVRSLDSTSGNRYPAMIGFDQNKGMMGMFTDPMDADSMDDATAIGALTNMFSAMGYTQQTIDWYIAQTKQAPGIETDGDAARYLLKSEMQEWTPIFGWWANEPKYLPLDDGTPGTSTNGAAINPSWRRKLVPINFIVAQMWDDPNPAVDANGDGGEAAGMHVEWDPWISRDMKAGMNFAPGPFATIPVGFGDGDYVSAYKEDFSFTGAFQYVGVYGGNVMLTTPEEISAYKTYRNSLVASGLQGVNKSWEGTQLVFQGGNPFQVTHNVTGTNVHALGKGGCADCHAPGADFFSGAYDMTGSGIPASPTYDIDGPCDTESGIGCNANDVPSTFMYRPVVDFEVVAELNDLRTGSESFDRSGIMHDVEFDELGCWDAATKVFTPVDGVSCTTATHRRTHDLGRDEFLYPELTDAEREARIQLLESVTITDSTWLSVDPVAKVASVTVDTEPQTLSDGEYAYQVFTGNSVAVTSDSALNTVGTFTYTWSTTSADATLTPSTDGKSVTATFPTQGTYQVVLKVQDEEGKVDIEVTTVTVKTAPVSAEATVVSGAAPGDVTVAFAGLPYDAATSTYGYDELVVYWGDGDVDKYYAHDREWTRVALLGAGTEELTHEYAEAGPYKVKVVIYTYNTTTERYEPIEVDPSRESIITVEAAPVTL